MQETNKDIMVGKKKYQKKKKERLFYDRVRDCTCGRAREREKTARLHFLTGLRVEVDRLLRKW